MIELFYLTSQIQCGANGDFLNIQVDVYQNQKLIKTLSKNERLLLPVNSINDVRFEYYTINNTTSCNLSSPSEQLLTINDPIPDISGVYEQQSIQTMVNGLNNYEELFLVELGTTDRTSPAFDLQDVVFIVNNNPVIFAD